MKDHLTTIDTRFPVRRTAEEKAALRAYVEEHASACGFSSKVEVLENKHHNLVVGDPDTAKVIFCAHYDTPANSLVPNLMLPRNPLLGMTYQLGIPILLALVSLGVAYGIKALLSLSMALWVVLYLVLYFALFFGVMRRGANPHNKNDNTSGVAALLSLMEQTQGQNVAFLLFDNEEKGTLGSKAYAKAHREAMADKLVLNLDCVGNGQHFLFLAKEGAERHASYAALTATVKGGDGYEVHFFPLKGSMSNSDYKHFPDGISVMACRRGRVGFYTPYIHTVKDTVADERNITFLAERLSAFVAAIGGKE